MKGNDGGRKSTGKRYVEFTSDETIWDFEFGISIFRPKYLSIGIDTKSVWYRNQYQIGINSVSESVSDLYQIGIRFA